MSNWQQQRLQDVALKAAARTNDRSRHKVFVSYHAADTAEVEEFLNKFGTEFIAKTVGVTDEDDFIDSEDTGYIMDKIRTKYLGDSTVTLVLLGSCTWARRYVDWEVYSSLRNSKHSTVNGLLAVQLPSISGTSSAPLQARVNDNIQRGPNGEDIGYARYYVHPSSRTSLRGWIEDAFRARTARTSLIVNTRTRRQRSATCP
ncbi:TIR domain-containing protein [Nocardioides zeae]|uniref:TIR domain-containing protein n=1 Tax=Nocardioides imazamoxiresistens TaxID=3231893 RepID=A0ABU3PRK5_9ACTN|nr:TIR domain-containing protein [Nocardioides zeae]MDT9591839.1 TIR domain-containing protein [Nocardioides zeae]